MKMDFFNLVTYNLYAHLKCKKSHILLVKPREFRTELKDAHKIVSFVNLPENAIKWALILR